MAYSTDSIDKVRNADIEITVNALLQAGNKLKKAGSVYKAKSPFADEKTPSFVVSPTKQIFKCFSTSLGGDGIKFVMLHEKVDFLEAVKIIAGIHNIFLEEIKLTPELQRKLDQKAELYQVIDKVHRKYLANFRNINNKHWAKQLLAEREFTKEVLVEFQIGFANNANDVAEWSIEHGTTGPVKELGLVKTKISTSYDVFKNRIMFPILNDKGVVLGFGGRQSDDPNLDKAYKYTNSTASEIYKKSEVLYGLYHAKEAIGQTGSVILTEGYTDVIAMFQNDCKNTVATSGTALSEDQAKLLKKYALEVILLRDGDSAGFEATLRDVDTCLSADLNVSVCILPEGEDPDTFSRAQLDMPTWIKDNKLDAILWKVSTFDVKRTRYKEDIEAIKETAKHMVEALKSDMVTSKAIAELSKDEQKTAKEFNQSLKKEIIEVEKQKKKDIAEIPEIDPSKKSFAVTSIADTLFRIKHEIKRNEYIKQVAKAMKVPVASLKAEIGRYEIHEQELKDKEKSKGQISAKNIKLPDGASMEEYMEGHMFVTVDNTFHFQRINTAHFFQGTTFKFTPLFHIVGTKENKRVAELINQLGQKRIVDFDTDMLASFQDFKKYLYRLNGKFMFLTHNGFRNEHFDRFVYRFEDQYEPAHELLTLGWTKDNFWAFANGIYWKDELRKVNKYGIIKLDGLNENKETNEYKEHIDNYYSPAFSIMHVDDKAGDDEYENDRYFVYKKADITLNDWMSQMKLVFQDTGEIGILFNFGSIFRDLFIANYTSFPLLGGFGEKDSGKSAFGRILQNFFYWRLPALDLTQATHVGFSRRLSRNTNTVQFCDEYQDKTVKEDVFNGLMGAWNGIGREKGKGVGTNKTSYDHINSAVYYAGQFMPTKMENALATRTISRYFQTKNFTLSEKANFNKLLNWTNSGISSLVVDIVQHRSYFEKRLPSVQASTEKTLKELLKAEQYQERVFINVSMLLTTYNILKDKIEFPFNDDHIEKLCAQIILDNSEQISDSNGLTEFWSTITYLFETGRIKEDRDFVIDRMASFKLLEKKQSVIYHNTEGKQILYLRLKMVYQSYVERASKLEGIDVIGQTTLRHYFKSRPYFIGLVKAKRFGKAGSESCYAFDYTMMTRADRRLLNLEEDNSINLDKEEIETVEKAKDNATEPSLTEELAGNNNFFSPDA